MPFPAAWRPLLEREVRARVVAVCLFERVDRRAQALGGAVLRHLDHQTDVEIARRATLGVGDPAPAESQALPSLAALRDLQLYPSLGGGDLDGRTEHRFPDRHRHLHDEIPRLALEVGVRADLDDEVQVARGGAASGTALPLDPHARPVAHPGGNLDREALALLHGARARAARAGAHALAARAATRGGRRWPPDRHRRLRTADCVQEVDLDRMLDVIAPVGCAARGRSPAEHLGEDVAEAPLRLRLPAPSARSRLPEVEAEALGPFRSGTKGEAVPALAPALILACPPGVESGLEPGVPELV